MFSVIIPLYNKASHIEKAVDSVLRQTFQDFELIIIDDGSTDGGVSKLGRYEDSRLRIIRQSNFGVSISRNIGVSNARFSLVAFLDADDWWDERFLEEMDQLIAKFPEAAMYGSAYYVVKNGTHKPAQIGLEAGFEAGYIDYFQVYSRTFWVPINCSFVVLRKSVFEDESGFKPELKFGEDLDLWIRIALKHKTGYVNKYLAYSNQDVAPAGRALGMDKHWKKTEHVIFNLDYLGAQEADNPPLKMLLDGLRVRSLQPFYLNASYPQETQDTLAKVDFSKQPPFYRYLYYGPKKVIITYFRLKKLGSLIKQSLLRNYRALPIYRRSSF
ncbi:glycosyltransferase family 2 protein [Dyadobacter alkalitolerans]|uniref:glycosyltransferase family 2 protein n=1 Tax=Dyadobacter alkalitolerans TaxID=492736 RepID=UPI0004187869|nr:glycosyltransferase [Dyadobacter alkalitolerans]